MPTPDLRQRLAAAITDHLDCSADATTGEWRYICDCGTAMPTDDVDEADRLHEAHQAVAALVVFAACLRERADIRRSMCAVPGPSNAKIRDAWADGYEALADEIDPKEASGEQ